jgi:hypothetical protein
MTRRTRTIIICAAALLLSACAREEAASFTIDGDPNHSLSLMRETYPWRKVWEVRLVTTHKPDCLRRHSLQRANKDAFKVELYRPEAGVFILNQDGRWYVTETRQCRLQAFEETPPAPGERLGEFAEKDGVLVFIDATGRAADPITLR